MIEADGLPTLEQGVKVETALASGDGRQEGLQLGDTLGTRMGELTAALSGSYPVPPQESGRHLRNAG
jgi:hypothetical protein